MMWLGIDGGGTKTTFSIFDESLCRINTFRLQTCHFGQVGFDGMKEVLAKGIHLATQHGLQGEYGVGLGLCGYGLEDDIRIRMNAIVSEVVGAHPYELISDVAAACAASLDLSDGVVIVSGTGSIAYGVHGSRRARCGGWGYQIGDEGSGWWLGKELVRVFSRQADGRNRRGQLYNVVMENLKLVNDYDLIGYMRDVVGEDRTKTAAMGQLVAIAAEAGDKDAIEIYRSAAIEEADLVQAVINKIFSEEQKRSKWISVSWCGGTFKAGKFIFDPLEQKLPSCCQLVPPVYGPDAGACLLLRQRLAKTSMDTPSDESQTSSYLCR